MSKPIYVSTEELPVSFGDPKPHRDAERRILLIKEDLAAELEKLAKSVHRYTLRDALRWLGDKNAEYRIIPEPKDVTFKATIPGDISISEVDISNINLTLPTSATPANQTKSTPNTRPIA